MQYAIIFKFFIEKFYKNTYFLFEHTV